jgi:hypothetical protein
MAGSELPSAKTQRQIAEFFRENAGVFDEIIIDDFYCSEDTSPESDKARGARDWGQYRRDLLVGLLPSMVFEPARAVRPDVKLIIKYPQWYDRFHLFGYEPARMSAPFNPACGWARQVRNPKRSRYVMCNPSRALLTPLDCRGCRRPRCTARGSDHSKSTCSEIRRPGVAEHRWPARELTLFNCGTS